MASECGGDNLVWKCGLVLCCLALTGLKTVTGGCGYSNKRYKNEDDSKCWYKLWYFWFIVILVFLTIVVLIIFYCKHHVKRSTGRRGRRRTPVLTMPIAPPEYEAPGYEPPPYHIAMTTTSNTAGPDGANHAAQGAPSSASSQQVASLPGYIMDRADLHAYDNLSMGSTISMGAFSNPPPYSSPVPPPASQGHARHQQADIAL